MAIIVILAIIAVITVPIILNIIENSRKGAAQDSAYGFKDSVNKLYISKLSEEGNRDLKLDKTYTVIDGVISGAGLNEKVPASGIVSSSGSLTYENGVFKSGCLVIGEYAVTFNTDGTTSTEKGECPEVSTSAPTIATCPGCKFIFTTNEYAIEGSTAASIYNINMPTEQDGLTDDYTELTNGANGHPYFLGLIERTTPGKIGRAFACGVENGTPFCIEGTKDGSKYSSNVDILESLNLECDVDHSDTCGEWTGVSVNAEVYGSDVNVTDDSGICRVGNGVGVSDENGYHYVHYDGFVGCSEY